MNRELVEAGVGSMDNEMREYLDLMRRDILGAVREGDEALRKEMRQEVAGLREEVGGLREEVVVGYEAMHKETRREITTLREEIRVVDQGLRVLVEDVRDEVRVVADGVAMVNEKLDRHLEDHERGLDQRIGPMETVVRNLSNQVQDHDRRIRVLEGQGGR